MPSIELHSGILLISGSATELLDERPSQELAVRPPPAVLPLSLQYIYTVEFCPTDAALLHPGTYTPHKGSYTTPAAATMATASRRAIRQGHRRLDAKPSTRNHGVRQELERRYDVLLDDYTTALQYPSKTLSSALFLFFATLFSTVALGAHLQIATNNRVGLSEYLLMNSLGGMLHALIGVQPLLVIRPTGPITAIMGKLSILADQLSVDFFELLAATGVCVSICMFAIAFTRLSTLARRFTPFTLDIFACFVCSIYVVDGVSDCFARFDQGTMANFGRSLLDLNLAIVTFGLSVKLQSATQWRCLFPFARELLADYAVTIAVVVSTLCSYAVPIAADQVLRIDLPPNPRPTCRLDRAASPEGGTMLCLSPLAVDDAAGAAKLTRSWFVGVGSLFGAGSSVWLPALAAAVPIAFFFFFDQNISILFSQRTPGGLGRGRYVHSSFVALGILNGIGPWAGLPFLTGSLPHSPQFVRALTVRAEKTSKATAEPVKVKLSLTVGSNGVVGAPAGINAAEGINAERNVYVAENRIAPLLVYALIGLPLLAPRLLLDLPGATIDGVLVFVGYEGIIGTDLFRRALMIVSHKKEFDPAFRGLRKRRISLYTGLQLALLALCWVINKSPYGLAVAFLIVALVPLRERLLPRLFSADELARLDAHADREASEEEGGLQWEEEDREGAAEVASVTEEGRVETRADHGLREEEHTATCSVPANVASTILAPADGHEGEEEPSNSRWSPDALAAKLASSPTNAA